MFLYIKMQEESVRNSFLNNFKTSLSVRLFLSNLKKTHRGWTTEQQQAVDVLSTTCWEALNKAGP